MKNSYGFIETRSFISAIEAADVMLKTARVHPVKVQKIGSALITVIVQGELAACQAAVDAGSSAVEKLGELISAHVIPRPDDDTGMLVTSLFKGHKPPKPEKPVSPSKIKEPVKTKPKLKKPKPLSGPEEVLQLLGGQTKGLTLQDICGKTGKSSSEVRQVLKQFMDQELVEKVHQRYFLIKKGNIR